MGGDHGPSVTVPAAIEVLKEYANLELLLVGKKELLKPWLEELDESVRLRLTVIHASQVVAMDEKPSFALRGKKDSSMRVAINLVKDQTANACVSAGNTGALMAISRFVLRMLRGVDRPAIVYSLPTMRDPVHVLDLGANVDCQAEHLLQFGMMGSILAKIVSKKPRPKVALLNIGEEAVKGSELVKQANELFIENKNKLNYIGFVEADHMYEGVADVIVCDGFVGNVALKTSEGLAKLIMHFAKEEFTKSWWTKLCAFISSPVLKALRRRLDPKHYNGASLLGLRGIVIKSHGGAKKDAFKTAIKIAIMEAEKDLPTSISEAVQQEPEMLK